MNSDFALAPMIPFNSPVLGPAIGGSDHLVIDGILVAVLLLVLIALVLFVVYLLKRRRLISTSLLVMLSGMFLFFMFDLFVYYSDAYHVPVFYLAVQLYQMYLFPFLFFFSVPLLIFGLYRSAMKGGEKQKEDSATSP